MFANFFTVPLHNKGETGLTASETFKLTIQGDVNPRIYFIAVIQIYADGSQGSYRKLWKPENGSSYICNIPNHTPKQAHKLRLRLPNNILNLATALPILVETYDP